jgi:hypothetical protein
MPDKLQTTDLPRRLRQEFMWRDVPLEVLVFEAADEIERLREIIRVRHYEAINE